MFADVDWPPDDGIRVIAAAEKTRLPELPDTPTIDETVPGVVNVGWNGLLAPAGTPVPIIAKLHQEAVKIVQHPHLVENFGKIGLDVVADPPDAFASIIRNDTAKWAKVIKDAGIKPGE